MGFRVLLVGLVAGLGLDLPSGSDLERWLATGRGWVEDQVSAWSVERPGDVAGGLEARGLASDSVPMPAAVADEVFEGAVDQLKAAFADDLAPAVAPEAPRLARFEPVEPAEDLYPGLAYALNRQAEGQGDPDPEPGPPAPTATAPEGRLATAVRLTGAAVHAWMDLLRKGPALVSIEP